MGIKEELYFFGSNTIGSNTIVVTESTSLSALTHTGSLGN